jgi:hypothetical protein
MSDLLERLRHGSQNEVMLAATEAADEIERLQAEVNTLEFWNYQVRVCKDHTEEIVGEGCAICDLEKQQAVVDAAREVCRRWDTRGLGNPLPGEHPTDADCLNALSDALRALDGEVGP